MKCRNVNPNPLFDEVVICAEVPRLRSITICRGDFTDNRAGFTSLYMPALGRVAFKDIGPNELSRLEEHDVSELTPKLDDWCDDLGAIADGLDQDGWTEHSLCSLAAS